MRGIRNRVFPWAVAVLLSAVCATLGCSSMWESVRESQRLSSVRLARELVERGSCERALETIGRAQSTAELGRFEAESIWLRARCLSRLERSQQALAHWRLLADHYSESPFSRRIPAEVREQLGRRAETRAPSSPKAFEAPQPRYEPGAQQAKLVGSVWLEFDLDEAGGVGDIRVIETPHPLLASFAVEALALGKWTDRSLPVRMGRYGAKYRFEHHFAQPASKSPRRSGTAKSASTDGPSGSGTPAEPGNEDAAGTDTAGAESEEGSWEIEWFPTYE